jgi:hypothetical protein
MSAPPPKNVKTKGKGPKRAKQAAEKQAALPPAKKPAEAHTVIVGFKNRFSNVTSRYPSPLIGATKHIVQHPQMTYELITQIFFIFEPQVI